MPSNITIGYEGEYFVKDSNGTIIHQIPYDLPYDGGGRLVEVRSHWYPDPSDTLDSYKSQYDILKKQVKAKGLELVLMDGPYTWTTIPKGFKNPETAGLHVHFSRTDGKRWNIPDICDDLTKHFKVEIGSRISQGDGFGSGGKFEHFRIKPHGWEYRLLPATIDLKAVTKFIEQRLPVWEAL